MSNERKTVLYTGVTNDLERRVYEHTQSIEKNSFTSRYNVNKLVYCEAFEDVEEAISREKRIKAGSGKKKLTLIESMNPEWKDLSIA